MVRTGSSLIHNMYFSCYQICHLNCGILCCNAFAPFLSPFDALKSSKGKNHIQNRSLLDQTHIVLFDWLFLVICCIDSNNILSLLIFCHFTFIFFCLLLFFFLAVLGLAVSLGCFCCSHSLKCVSTWHSSICSISPSSGYRTKYIHRLVSLQKSNRWMIPSYLRFAPVVGSWNTFDITIPLENFCPTIMLFVLPSSSSCVRLSSEVIMAH